MKVTILPSIKGGLGLLLILFSVVSAPLSTLPTAYAAGGNNGTLKVHEFGTASGTESNDPKVCAFNLEGFGFDPAQSGYVNLDPQGGSSPVGVAAGPFNFGPTDATGYAETQYFNTVGGTAIANGTYKATLYGKDTGGNIDLTDEKAKSKVFKVDCAPPTTSVTPADVTFVEECGTANDTYTIPATNGVIYQISGTAVPADTYAGSGTVTVTAVADSGYSLTGTTTWQHTFTDVACPLTEVTATAPTSEDLTCEENGSYTVPETTGVIYKVNGTVTPADTYPVSAAGSVTITAEAAQGYVLSGPTSWTFNFHEPEDCEPPVTDLCPNIVGPQTQIPAGYIVDTNGNCVTPGRGGGSDILNLFTPTIQTVETSVTPAPIKELVNTGSSVMLNLFMGLFIAGSTVVVTILSRQGRTVTAARISAKTSSSR